MKVLLLVNFILGIGVLHARNVEDVLEQRETKRARYILKAPGLESMVINMSFAQSAIISTANRQKLKGATIFQIDLVYSDFPKGIELTNLNRQRIQKALELRSDLIKDESIQWRLIRQMDCSSEAEAQTLFHGIVIHFRSVQNNSYAKIEQAYYDSILPKNHTVTVSKKVMKQFKDSVVAVVFRRNKWSNATVITDVTCSMSPYVAQFALWHFFHLKEKPLCNVVFFNDGDGMPNELKVVGKTGGIFMDKIDDYERLVDLIMKATASGCSGDIEENGLEALLAAQQKFSNAKELIYIADNFAPLRDMELLSQLKVPVRIVVCGADFGINPHLVEIAFRTNGSIHTMEADLKDFASKKEGDVIRIGKASFRIQNGMIVRNE